MKKNRAIFLPAALLVFGAVIIPLLARGSPERVFMGEIGDSQCAFDVHSLTQSHKEMIAMGHAGKTSADCTRYCVRERGGRFVLQVKDKVYKLDDQELAEPYAGSKVRLTGILDEKTDEIHVISIKSIEAHPPKQSN
jgi:Protein of unknown function (DUF5818)